MSKIKKSKNVISDATISAGGNVHIGDVTNVYHNAPTKKEEDISIEKETIVNEARKLIAANKIKEAIKYLEKETASLKGSIPKQIAQQSAKWNKFKEEDRMNLLSHEQRELQYSRIVNNLLEIVDVLQNR